MERLQKVIAHAGIASRRKSEELIASGRVQVNGETVVELGTKVSVHDIIVVDGVPLSNEAPVYILMYKPKKTSSQRSLTISHGIRWWIYSMKRSRNAFTRLVDLIMIRRGPYYSLTTVN